MKVYDPSRLAELAVAARPNRPATATIHDAPGSRMVVFRIAPGQHVPPHTNPSTVILAIVSGTGIVSGADGECPVRQGEVIAYEPNEVHGMRAEAEPFVVLAIIAPRPSGAR